MVYSSFKRNSNLYYFFKLHYVTHLSLCESEHEKQIYGREDGANSALPFMKILEGTVEDDLRRKDSLLYLLF